MTARDIDAAVAALAANQAGCFNRRQVLLAGGTDTIIKARLRSGAWERVGSNAVYAVPSAPASPLRKLWVPHLAIATPSVVSHEAAAEVQGVRCFPIGMSTLLTPHGASVDVPGTTVHQTRDPWPPPTTIVAGLPVTTVPETILALSGLYRRARIERAVDDAVVRRLMTIPEISARLRSVRRKGKPGVRLLGAVLDARLHGYVPPASDLERQLADVLERAAIVAVRQFAHPGRDLPAACVDAADVAARIIFEADGRTWHQRIEDVKRDHHRDNEALRVGWITIRLTWEELFGDPAGVVGLILDARAARMAA